MERERDEVIVRMHAAVRDADAARADLRIAVEQIAQQGTAMVGFLRERDAANEARSAASADLAMTKAERAGLLARLAEVEAGAAAQSVAIEALEELLEVATLRGDDALPPPPDDPKLWTARMQDAWDNANAAMGALSPDAGRALLDRHAADIARKDAALADVADYRGGADCACRDEHVMERVRAALLPGGGASMTEPSKEQ